MRTRIGESLRATNSFNLPLFLARPASAAAELSVAFRSLMLIEEGHP